MKLELGRNYSRNQLHQIVGAGSKQSYVPEREGVILCGCFDPELNVRAPSEIDAGPGPRVISGAKRLASANYPIPVFLKRRFNSWEFVGHFKCTGHSQDPKDLYPNVKRRKDAVLVLYLE